jgi:predicted Zn-dependent protease with MMP-like domain
VFHLDDKQFEQIVASAIDNIPPKYAEHIKNLAFVVEDEPTPEQRTKLKLRPYQTLFGLYEGVPLTSRSGNYNLVLPDKITIFKNPIEHTSNNLEEVIKQVNNTVWHEVAHYYGLGHGRIDELENKHHKGH